MTYSALENAKEHYHFELARRAEINSNLKNNIQLALGGIGFLFVLGQGDIKLSEYQQFFYWLIFLILITSIFFSSFAGMYYSTRFPDDPEKIERGRDEFIGLLYNTPQLKAKVMLIFV